MLEWARPLVVDRDQQATQIHHDIVRVVDIAAFEAELRRVLREAAPGGRLADSASDTEVVVWRNPRESVVSETAQPVEKVEIRPDGRQETRS